MLNGVALAPYKFIVHLPRIRSGLPIRGGLARLAAVGYMCKAWTWKDWMGFADIFGMPMRVGRYGPSASKDDINTLMSAVANLGSDAAAVIPDSMKIDFTHAANVAGAGTSLKAWRNGGTNRSVKPLSARLCPPTMAPARRRLRSTMKCVWICCKPTPRPNPIL